MISNMLVAEYLEIIYKITKVISRTSKKDSARFLSNITFAIKILPCIKWKYWLHQYLKICKIMPDENIDNILSKGQILGKKWLLEEIKRLDLNYGIIFLLAGWSGFIARLLLDSNQIQFEKIRSFDINPNCTKMAEILNKDWRYTGRLFKSSTKDITELNYLLTEFDYIKKDGKTKETLIESPRTIINTSCEHLNNFKSWWDLLPKGLITIIQSTDNYELDDHLNAVKNIEEFKKQAPMSKILYCGEREFFYYKRFMIIGIK